MQAAVNAEMLVAGNAETTVEVIGSRSGDNRMKTGKTGWLEFNFIRKVRCVTGGGNKNVKIGILLFWLFIWMIFFGWPSQI